MISLHSILATGLASKLPTLIFAVTAVALAIAFSMGFVKGFRKVSWNGLIWATAAAIFSFVGLAGTPSGGVTRQLVVTLAVAIIYIVATLIFYGILAHFLRPKVRWVKDNVNGDTSLAEYGLEFEPEYVDYDGEDDPRPYGKRLQKTGCNPPSIIGRLLGGISCALNVGMLFWAVGSVGLLAISSTGLSNMVIGTVLEHAFIAKLLKAAQRYLLEWLCIGVIVVVAKVGFKNGLLNSLRTVIITIGSVALIGFCFYLPFSPLGAKETGLFSFVNKFIVRCSTALKRFPLPPVVSKLFAGCCFAGCGVVFMIIVNILLKKCCNLVDGSAPTRMVDRLLSCVVYIFAGVIALVAVWVGLAVLDRLHLFHISEVLNEYTPLSNALFNFAKQLVSELRALI